MSGTFTDEKDSHLKFNIDFPLYQHWYKIKVYILS